MRARIDLRLRPNGNAGLMVSSFDAFSRYQRNEDGLGAWVWEHQALTRARPVAGEARLQQAFTRLRAQVLTRARIEDSLYAWGDEVESNAIEVHVHHLRRKLGPALIETVRGVGYVLRRGLG